MAEIEKRKGVNSTFFTLISSDFYNPFSANNTRYLKEIIACGHEIGLHFDEVKYKEATADEIKKLIAEEAWVLEKATGAPVRTVSMHRPSRAILDANLQVPGIINSYDHTYFEEFKYLSDSRRRWREPVEDIINEGRFNRLHILTHAFWYNEEEKDIGGSIREFVNCANEDRYYTMADNISDIAKIMSDQEVLHERYNR